MKEESTTLLGRLQGSIITMLDQVAVVTVVTLTMVIRPLRILKMDRLCGISRGLEPSRK